MADNQTNVPEQTGDADQQETKALWPRKGRQLPLRELIAGLSQQASENAETSDDPQEDNSPVDEGELQDQQLSGGKEQPAEVKEKSQVDEIAKLRHELNSAQGRLKPTQQRLEATQSENANLRAQLETAQRRIAELEASQKELEELRHSRKAYDVKARIQEQFPDVDPAYAEAIVSAVSEFNQPHTASVQQQQTAQPQQQQAGSYGQVNVVQDKITQVLADTRRNVGSLRAMAGDQDFRDWVDSRPDVGAVLTVFMQSTSVEDVEKYAEQIDRFMDEYFDRELEQPSQPASTPVRQQPAGVNQHLSRNGKRTIDRREYERRRAIIMPKLRSRDAKERAQANKELSELQSLFRN